MKQIDKYGTMICAIFLVSVVVISWCLVIYKMINH